MLTSSCLVTWNLISYYKATFSTCQKVPIHHLLVNKVTKSLPALFSLETTCCTGPESISIGVWALESSNVREAPTSMSTPTIARCPKCRALCKLLHPNSPSWETIGIEWKSYHYSGQKTTTNYVENRCFEKLVSAAKTPK